MKAAEIMTKRVFTVTPTTKVKELAALLHEKKVSGVPVLQDGALMGIVTEADILARKPGQNLVRNIMKTNVISITEESDVKEIAGILTKKKIKRVPVLRDGKVVGIVSRADIVKSIA